MASVTWGLIARFRFVVVRCCLHDGLFLRVLAGFGVPVGTGCAFRPVAASWFVNVLS